jgi:hypothetical protein
VRRLAIASAVAALAFLALPPAALAEQQLLDPNRTLDDGWHTRPARLTVRQPIDDGCRFPALSACAPGDFAYGDRRRERYEVAFEDPRGEDVSFVKGTVYVLARHRSGSRSAYALRVTRNGVRRGFRLVHDVARNGWVRFSVPLITIAEERTLSLAGGVTSGGGRAPLVKNFVAYVGLDFAPAP